MKRLVLIIIIVATGCTHLIFQPLKKHVLDPADYDIEYVEHYFTTSDDVRLHGWLLPAKGSARGTILFSHGNAENISTHINSVWWLPNYGYNVFLFDYRGYGLSAGEPTLDGVIMDMNAATKKVLSIPEVREKGIVIFGQSIGANIVITAVSQMEDISSIKAVVVEGAMTSFRDISRQIFGTSWLTWAFQWPLGFTVDDRYRAIDEVTKFIDMPFLIIHSRADQIIPYHHGVELYEAANEPKFFWEVEKAKHISVFNDKVYRKRFIEWLDKIF